MVELETDMDVFGGIIIEEETCEEESRVTVFVQGQLEALDDTRGYTTHMDSMEDPLSLTNIDDIKQEYELPDNITIKQENPWAEQSNSETTVSAGYRSTEEEGVSAHLRKDEPLDAEADEASVKIEILENEVDPGPSSTGGADVLQCEHCAYTCLGQDLLHKHVRNRHGHLGRNGKYQCNKCAYSTDHLHSIRDHQVTHTGERPFPCEQCDKAFTKRSNLTQHIRTVHDGLRPHSCNVCGKSFTHPGHLTRHQRIHSGTSVVQCTQCGKQFTSRSSYIAHMKRHDSVKAHKCHVCSARFVERGSLTRHMRTHTGERPYPCPHCSATFNRQSDMKKHIISIHTHDFKHHCQQCGKGYVKLRCLRKHSAKCSL